MKERSSPFGRETRAIEVVSGIDLSGKRAIVTGASSGIGIETARALTAAGCEVILAVRNRDAGERSAKAMVDEFGGAPPAVASLDLSDLKAVESFAKSECSKPLDILICNAAVMACPFGRTRDGFELQLGVNHVGHAILVKRLLPALGLAAAARVVVVSSSAHWWSSFDFDDPNFDRKPYDKFKAYGQSKTANILYALAFNRRYSPQGITANALMPGNIMTALGRHLSSEDYKTLGIDGKHSLFVKNVEQGAATSVWAAVAPGLEARGGLYLEDCQVAPPGAPENPGLGVAPYATDPVSAERLWEWTESLDAARSSS
jgi:NAD(P)-dependent dehydrogenase (short-subunit alcohol dehydrogenase family)